jgi:manganese/zinc/iron transport system substrate-binding protein
MKKIFSMRTIRLLLFLAACLPGLVGCGGTDDASNQSEPKPLVVLATTTQVSDLLKAIGGERVEVLSLMGPGVDPHLFKLTAGDNRKLREAELIFYNGLGLEGRMGGLFQRLEEQGRAIFAVSGEIPREQLIAVTEEGKTHDPHIWFDPELWMQAAQLVAKRLGEADPSGAEVFQENLEVFSESAQELKEWGREHIAGIPEANRLLVTSHDAFSYFGRAFDIEVVAIQGISTVSEAGLADLSAMIDLLKERQVPSIFVESSVSQAAIERVSSVSGVAIGGELYSDAMGSPGEMKKAPDGSVLDVGTWDGMLRHNIHLIVEGLSADE